MNAAICRTLLLSALILATSIPVAAQVRIIQTNSQGDNIHLIDPATNQIVGEVLDDEKFKSIVNRIGDLKELTKLFG